jgi:hypothetical protein
VPILTPTQKSALATELAKAQYQGLTDQQAADLLNAHATVANPAPQGQVPIPFNSDDAAALIGTSDLAKILALPGFDSTIRPLLEKDPKTSLDITALNRWAAGLFKAGDLTQGEFDALAAPTPGTTAGAATGLFNRAEADPSWQADVTGPSVGQQLFPGATFVMPDGSSVYNTLNAAIVAEARA